MSADNDTPMGQSDAETGDEAERPTHVMGHRYRTQNTHTEALADVNDGYTAMKGWGLACLWCDWSTFQPTKAEAVEMYQIHERAVLREEFDRG